MSESDDPTELHRLSTLPRELEPDPAVEERVVAALRARGLVGRPRRPRPPISWWRLAAAVLVAAALGWGARGWVEGETELAGRIDSGPEFLLLLAEPEGLRTARSQAELVEEYRRWAQELAGAGRLVAAARLEDGGRRLTGARPGEIVEAAEDAVGAPTGFFVVRAAGWEEAMGLARGCPHLGYGGEISVRALAGGHGTEDRDRD